MIDRLRQYSRQHLIAGPEGRKGFGWLTFFTSKKRWAFKVAFIAILLAIVYWAFIASNRYVSEAHILIQRSDLNGTQSVDVGSLLSTVNPNPPTDQLLLRDYLLSVDMMQILDAKLDLRAHYSDKSRDIISRMWSKDMSLEWFHQYYLSRVQVEYDDYAGVLVIKAQGYTPEVAKQITSLMVSEGERYMNALAQSLAQDQVDFLEKQADRVASQALEARRKVLNFQNAKNLVSPESTTESLTGLINNLEAQVSDLQAKRNAMLGYLSPTAPAITEINLSLAAVQNQIKQEQKRLTSTDGKTLNSTVEQFQRLKIQADFAQEIYQTTLVALEKGRVEATRRLKKVAILQQPTLPQYAEEPRRAFNIAVFILVALLLAGIVHLIAAIIQDHKD